MSIVSERILVHRGLRSSRAYSFARVRDLPHQTAPPHCTEIALHSLAIVSASLALADAIAAIAVAADKTQHCHSHSIAAK